MAKSRAKRKAKKPKAATAQNSNADQHGSTNDNGATRNPRSQELEEEVAALKMQLEQAQQTIRALQGSGANGMGPANTISNGSTNDGTNGSTNDGINDDNDETETDWSNHVAVDLSEQPMANSPSMLTSISPPAVFHRPLGKKGYLFKWQDRSIGWGGTKWALRFVALEDGKVAYFGSHHDPLTSPPRYVLNLKGCAVRDEGWKRNRRHKSTSRGRTNSGDGSDEPPLDESGAYFFVFSIYLRQDQDVSQRNAGRALHPGQAGKGSSILSQSSSDSSSAKSTTVAFEDVVPLLRFSTPSLAEKQRWIQLISETCAYCETEAYLQDEADRYDESRFRREQQMKMALAMPEAKTDGTLPPLYFAPASTRRFPKRHPSHSRLPLDAKLFRSKTADPNADKVESRSIKGYPPSKPMHRSAAPSYLSLEAPPQNYRGLFNLGIIILVVSNFRLMLGTVRRHGFVITKLLRHLQDFPTVRYNREAWQEFPILSALMLQVLFVITAFGLERLLSRRRLPNSFGMMLHYANAYSALLLPTVIVWKFIESPPVGSAVLMHATITWMKLVSYAHANDDYRASAQSMDKDAVNPHNATLALIENLEDADLALSYPQNVTLNNLLYFWCAPTLTYQIAFPKYPKIRLWKILAILLRMGIVTVMFTFLAAQFVSPTLQSLVTELDATHGRLTMSLMAEYWLRLSIANTYLWLLMFYAYFHLYLNLIAEVLRFGDRVFYKDWWNSSDVSSYWRLWNMPVHFWLIRHVYFPCIRCNMPKVMATFVVFLVSAVMHEVLVSVPFHMIRPWSFLGMMMQLPLVAVTKFLCSKFPGSSIGNLIFWISFCVVGQPMAILLYTVDYQYEKQFANVVDACSAAAAGGGVDGVVGRSCVAS